MASSNKNTSDRPAWWQDDSASPDHRPNGSGFVASIRSHVESTPVLRGMPPFFIDQTFEGHLGTGGFYDVQKKTIDHDGKPTVVAVKRLKPEYSQVSPGLGRRPLNPTGLRTMLREIQVMEIMETCPFIPQMFECGSWSDPVTGSVPFLVVELAPAGTLSEFLDIKSPGPTEDLGAYIASRYFHRDYALRRSLLVDIAQGLHALHQNGIFHTDVKPANILIFGTGMGDDRYSAKVSDFGSSIMRNTATPDKRILLGRDSGGTDGYRAPELGSMSASDILGLCDSDLRKLDVYSYGAVVIEAVSSCMTIGLPFDKDLTLDSVSCRMDFVRHQIGEPAWKGEILTVLESSLVGAATRIANFADTLALLGQEAQSTVTKVTSSGIMPLPGASRTSGMLAFADSASQILGVGDDDLDIQTILQDDPMAAFEFLGCLRHYRAGHNDLLPFQDLLRQWTEHIPQDSAEHYFISGLSHILGCGVIDFDKCCEDVLEAARRGNIVAQTVYRRLHEALFSIYQGEEGHRLPSTPSPTAIRDINPNLFRALDDVFERYPDNALAHLHRFWSRCNWALVIRDRLFETLGLVRAEEVVWDVLAHETIHDERIGIILRKQIELLRNLPQGPKSSDEYELLVAAAIVFGDDQPGDPLELLCDALENFGLSVNFVIKALDNEPLSPLMLASYCGNANAVRVLARPERGYPAINRHRSGSGPVPLHYLFMFPDGEIDDMCRILAKGLGPEDAQCKTHYPEGRLFVIYGSPLDFAFKMGSAAAVRSLWLQIYSKSESLLEPLTFVPGMRSEESEKLPDMIVTTPFDAFAIRCCGSLQPAIFDFFLSLIEADPSLREKTTATFREPRFDGDTANGRGNYYFTLVIMHISSVPLSHLVLHGPKYTERLIWQLRRAIELFMDISDSDFVHYLFGQIIHYPDPHIQVATVEACRDLGRDLGIASKAAQYVSEILKLQTFTFTSKGASQRLSLGHSLGFVMPKHAPPTLVLEALAAAAAANDTPAFRRIVQKSTTYEINLLGEGAVYFLCTQFTKGQPADPRPFLDMVSEMRVPSKPHWFWNFAPTWWHRRYFDQTYSETGYVLWDAVKYNNLALILWMVDRDPSSLHPERLEPSVLSLLCTNDRHAKVLRGVLEHLGPARSLEILQRRTRFSKMTAMDVAVLHESTQCLLEIARFLTGAGASMDDLFPSRGEHDSHPLTSELYDSLMDFTRGYKVFTGITSLIWERRPLGFMSPEWRHSAKIYALENFAHPRVVTLVPFVWEMTRHGGKVRHEALQAFVQEIFGRRYDITQASQATNYSQSVESLSPGQDFARARTTALVGRLAARWKLSLLVFGIGTYTSIAVSRLAIEGLRKLVLRR